MRLAMAFANEEEAVKGFRRLIEVGIGGILYYGGLLLRYQAQEQGFKPSSVFGIYAGGNGSKLFHWAFGSTFAENSVSANRLGEVFKTASGFDQTQIVIRLSEEPKSEVAYGLAAKDKDSSLTIAGPMAGLLPCEAYISGNAKADPNSWKKPLLIGDLRAQGNGIRVDPDLPQFKQFLKAIGASLDSVQQMDLVANINMRLASAFSGVRQAANDQAAEKLMPRGEPLWVLAFKAYLEEQIHAWARSL